MTDHGAARRPRSFQAVRLIAGREIVQRVRARAFRIATLLLMIIAAGGVLFSSIQQGSAGKRTVVVGLLDGRGARDAAEVGASTAGAADPDSVEAALRSQGEQAKVNVVVLRFDSSVGLERAVRSEKVNVGVNGTEMLWNKQVDPLQSALVLTAVQIVNIEEQARIQGIDAVRLAALIRPVELAPRVLQPEKRDRGVRMGTAIAGVVFLFLTIQTYGSFLIVGVIEEKASRVVEVLLGQVRPSQLLAGKIAGIGIVGLLQTALITGTTLVAVLLARADDVPNVPLDALAWLLVWFLLGFSLYATLFAMAGSLVSRQEDAQSVTLPVMIPFLLTYFLALSAVPNPDSGFARVLSMFPLTAPLSMPVRIAVGHPRGWEIALAMALVLVSLVAVIQLAGRIYARNLLRTGARVTWRRALRPVTTRATGTRRSPSRRPGRATVQPDE